MPLRSVALVERVLDGTPLERVARRVWSELASIGKPRKRQSLQYDQQTEQIMTRVLRPDSNCVDIGAHKGSMLEAMLRLAPRGRHFAFEPLPALGQRLKERFPTVEVHDVALSDASGESTFCHIVDDPGLSSFRRMRHVPAGAVVKEIQVKTARLDNVLPADVPITFIKVDVEGAQLHVLRGAEAVIARSKPVIVFEHGMLAQESYGTTSEMMYELLVERYGLRLWLLADWLAGAPPLSRDAFLANVGYHAGSHFCFLAHS